jgi:DNA-binding XRE family transcriptional regulator
LEVAMKISKKLGLKVEDIWYFDEEWGNTLFWGD